MFFIDRFEIDKNLFHYIFCIEPSEDFNNRFPLLMASCLTDLSNKVTTKIRVMNPYKTDVSIQQDEVLGKAELIDPKNIDVILSSDSLFENQQSTRRIQLDKCSQKGDNSQTDNLGNSQKDECTNVSNVPDHLSDLYCRAIVDKNPDEKKEISIILHKYQDTFSKN